jgi:proteasome lid subunit RPN8/RPN11
MGGQFEFRVGVRRNGALLRSASASAGPCVEHARWRAVVLGQVPNGGFGSPLVEPVWADSGPPQVAGLRLALEGSEPLTYGIGVFEARAHLVIRDLVREKTVRTDEVVEWEVEAIGVPERPARFRGRAVREPYPFRTGPLDDVPEASLAVVVERSVLREIRAQVLAAPAVECAGVLAGALTHDPARRAARLTIGAHIPVAAGDGGTSRVHFAFGVNSFSAARRALEARGGAAVAAGWYHSHPPCADCARNPECRVQTVFFSADDVQVHAAAFPSAYAVALVAGKLRDHPATAPGVSLYAWREGRVAACDLAAAGGDGAAWVATVPLAGREACDGKAALDTEGRRRIACADIAVEKESDGKVGHAAPAEVVSEP